MRKLPTFILLLAMSMIATVHAADITDRAKCLAEIDTIKTLDQKADAGPKFEPIVDDLIGVLEHLCKEDAFEQANDIAAAIRVILSHRTTG